VEWHYEKIWKGEIVYMTNNENSTFKIISFVALFKPVDCWCIIQAMDHRPNTSFHPYITSTIILFIIGWGGAALAVFTLTPTVWARWLLFFGSTLGLTSLALPATWFLNLRFPSNPPAGGTVVMRQAIWVGVYGALLIWLQQERLVTIWTGIGLAVGLIAIEYFVRMRENARWQPPRGLPSNNSGQSPVDRDQTKE
jgi:hypothetical protein